MTPIKEPVEFPLRYVNEDGEVEFFDSIGDLECNLEDFHSENRPGCLLTDAKGRRVILHMSMMWIKRLELEPKC